ncbi:ALBINO3-like protein 3, mitochondrial, partial [Pistacia vera]|uniref:ALBINO3-like protein 3, mitochondrial n=1 Tax=Pistacia vera TaxID=55513 RepID=UPI0012635511
MKLIGCLSIYRVHDKISVSTVSTTSVSKEFRSSNFTFLEGNKNNRVSLISVIPSLLVHPVMGQTQLQKGLLAEAIEYLERAISKLFISSHPTKVENIDLLIVASQWAGVAYIRQGKMAEGIVHLERIANLEELEEKSSKAHYYDGLVLLSSALCNVGRKAEVVKHLHLAAAYNPEYNE